MTKLEKVMIGGIIVGLIVMTFGIIKLFALIGSYPSV